MSSWKHVAVHISYKIKKLNKYIENFCFYYFFPTLDYTADSDRLIGDASFTLAVRAVEAGGNHDGNMLIFISSF